MSGDWRQLRAALVMRLPVTATRIQALHLNQEFAVITDQFIEHNIPFYFLPHSGDNVVISEGEDDRYVVIQGDEEGRHL